MAGAQSIPNPSFEANTFAVYPGYISGNTPITGWTAGWDERVGLNPAGREVDADTIADATLVVESYESALAPPPAGAPELVGVDAADVHAELGELVSGDKPGRRSREEITLYKSVGIAVQDAAAAALVLAAARERSVGRELDLEGGG